MNPNKNNIELVRIAIFVTGKLELAMQQKGVHKARIIYAFEQTAIKEGFISPEAAKDLE
jgi:hypothetical protein